MEPNEKERATLVQSELDYIINKTSQRQGERERAQLTQP